MPTNLNDPTHRRKVGGSHRCVPWWRRRGGDGMLPVVNRGADNPTAAELRSRLVAARAAAERTLWSRPVRDILSALDRVVNAWLRPESPWLRRAELELPSVTGFT